MEAKGHHSPFFKINLCFSSVFLCLCWISIFCVCILFALLPFSSCWVSLFACSHLPPLPPFSCPLVHPRPPPLPLCCSCVHFVPLKFIELAQTAEMQKIRDALSLLLSEKWYWTVDE